MVLRSHQKGQATLELIPTLICFAMMLAVVSALCLYLYLQNITITVAREGARFASLNAELGTTATQAVGTAAVKSRISDMVQNALGSPLPANGVTITPPTGTLGNRLVKVKINMNITNPISIPDFNATFNGEPAKLFETIPLTAEASAHYEE
jgi:hypothetical protein